MKLSRSLRRAAEPAAFELIEEAVHLLRRIPPAWLTLYYAGSAPFILGLLFFWAQTTWFQPSSETVAWAALGLTALFIVMKATHAEFCSRLLAFRLGTAATALTWARFIQLAKAQFPLQTWALFALVPAAVLTVPVGWVYAYAQSATVIGAGHRLHEKSVAQAKLWPGQNHLGLTLISGIAILLAFNFGAAFYALPWIANHFLGLENVFNISGWSYLNTTFLASIALSAWLAVDPLIKAFYTLRVFHGQARRSGEDVRVEFRRGKNHSGPGFAAVLIVLLVCCSPAPQASAAPPTPETSAVTPRQLDRAIDETLANGDFPWRLRTAGPEIKEESTGPIARFFRKGAELLRGALKTFRRWMQSVADWLSDYFSHRKTEPEAAAKESSSLGVQRALLYGFVAAAVVLIGWLATLIYRQSSRHSTPVLRAEPMVPVTPDLRDDSVQAGLLPVDGWLLLARQQIALGEWRLALRALYLASLAHYAADGLLSLAKFKTNLDYERELRRRALSRHELVSHFSARRRVFEDAWYGQVEPREAEVREWMAELERPSLP